MRYSDSNSSLGCVCCLNPVNEKVKPGRKAKFCSNKCRQKFHRLVNTVNWSKEENVDRAYWGGQLSNDRENILGLSSDEMARRLGIPEPLYLLYESGKVGIPKLIVLAVKGLIAELKS